MICASCAISTTSLFGIYLGWQHVDGVQDSRWCWLIDLYFRYGSCDSDLNRKFGQLILWGAGPALHQHQWRQLSGSSRCVCVCVHFVDLALLLCPLNKALLGWNQVFHRVCYWEIGFACMLLVFKAVLLFKAILTCLSYPVYLHSSWATNNASECWIAWMHNMSFLIPAFLHSC